MIKKFKATTMREAMQMAKDQFGDNTILLKTKKLTDNYGNALVEITVTSDKELIALTGSAARSEQEKRATRPAEPAKVKPFYSPADFRPVRDKPQAGPSKEVMAELSALRSRLDDMSQHMRAANTVVLPETLRYLTEERGVEERYAKDLVQRTYAQLEGAAVTDDNKIRHLLHNEICQQVRTFANLKTRDSQPRIICLVGPTGMGKTTSIIKLATHPDFYGRQKVGLVTIDTYRVAAAAQLKTFAALARIPLEIVYEPEDFSASVSKFRDRDVILVDTAGRSPLNQDHLDDLRRFFQAVAPDEIHLVLSVSMHPRILADAAQNFAALPVNRLIVSKVDETVRLGNILNVGKKIDLPISFLTNGQRVPDDIHLADGHKIASMIMN
jgi:flagellar biosynthesis protein FlhF